MARRSISVSRYMPIWARSHWAKRRNTSDRTMAGYILRRVSEVIPTVFLVLTLVFLALRVMPGDPAVAALGEFATPDAIAAFRAKLGLNEALYVQYFSFVRHALTADFGRSMSNNAP